MTKKNIDVKDCKICIFGIQGSGKTFFVENYLMKKYKKPIIYLMHEEDFQKRGNHVKVIIPKDEYGNIDTSMKTLNQWSKKIKEDAINGEIDSFIIDEADLFILKDFRLLQKFSYFHDLVINHRHYGLAMVFITRRPQELPTMITEQSAHYFIFAVFGKNVKDYLNRIYDNLGVIASKLKRKEHKFIHLEFGEENPLRIYNPIKPSREKIQIIGDVDSITNQ